MGHRYITVQEEYQFGTLGTGTPAHFAPVSENIVPTIELLPEDTVENQRYTTAVPGAKSAAGPINLQLKPEKEIAWFLKWMFGDPTSDLLADDVYHHAYREPFAQAVKSFQTIIGAETYTRTINKCVVDSIVINIAKKAWVTAVVNVLGGDEEKGAAPGSMAAVTTLTPFPGGSAQITFLGASGKKWEPLADMSAEIEAATLNMSTGIPYAEMYALNSDTPARLEECGRREISFNFDGYFADADWYENFLAGDPFRIDVILVGGLTGSENVDAKNYKILFHFLECRLDSDTVFHVDRRERRIFNAPVTVYQNAGDYVSVMNKQDDLPDATA